MSLRPQELSEPTFGNRPELTDKEFLVLSSYVEKNVGIKMPETKRILMQSRLYSRLQVLRLPSFSAYIDFVFSKTPESDAELTMMIDALTTNLTEFFRESSHFDYLHNVILPEFSHTSPLFKIWSAGSSTGQEAYTMCMVISEFIRMHPDAYTDFSVFASDISTRVLHTAEEAVYPAEATVKIPVELKRRYLLRSKNRESDLVRVKRQLRNHVQFRQLNFMDASFGIIEKQHVIFCRNVLIYFDKTNQETIIRKFIDCLVPGGYLVLGHSETIMGMDLPLQTVDATVFKKQERK